MNAAKLTRLDEQGWDLVTSRIPDAFLGTLQDSIFPTLGAGARCLLDQSAVAKIARNLIVQLAEDAVISKTSVAIQAIAFDKTAGTNWKVSWHQDLMFPFAIRVTSPGFDLPSVKDGIDYARPPRAVLENLLAVRLHLDDCGESSGPLRVSPGTHRYGILRGSEVPRHVSDHGEITCLAKRGDALLMKPLTLHASSQATAPTHRRILHLVIYSGEPIPEPWHRTISPLASQES